jgi:hypothetical protein
MERRDLDPREPDSATETPEDDTEGHSLSTYEFGRSIVRERSREAERFAKESRLRKEAKDRKR